MNRGIKCCRNKRLGEKSTSEILDLGFRARGSRLDGILAGVEDGVGQRCAGAAEDGGDSSDQGRGTGSERRIARTR